MKRTTKAIACVPLALLLCACGGRARGAPGPSRTLPPWDPSLGDFSVAVLEASGALVVASTDWLDGASKIGTLSSTGVWSWQEELPEHYVRFHAAAAAGHDTFVFTGWYQDHSRAALQQDRGLTLLATQERLVTSANESTWSRGPVLLPGPTPYVHGKLSLRTLERAALPCVGAKG